MGPVRAVVLAMLLTLAVSTGCTSPAKPASTGGALAAAPLAWERLSLPDGLSAVTLATQGDQVLVGAYATGRPHPRLLRGRDPASLRPVPLSPRSPYAFEARWFSLAVHGSVVEAVGGARGGAHGNYRWSTWSGTSSGLAEQEQPFGVFGSWGAGDLVGIAFAGSEPVVLGAWQSDRTGLDIATWLRTGARWRRQSSTGTALGSTSHELVSAGAIAGDGSGLILSGSVTRLQPGAIRVDPAVWTTTAAGAPWSRVDLPRQPGTAPSEAHAATCSPARCLVVGAVGGRLCAWELHGTSARRLAGIPTPTLPDNGRALAPLALGDRDLVMVPVQGGSQLLTRRGETWSTRAGPPTGEPVSWVAHGQEVWLVTRDSAGVGTLWRTRP
ncbi:hypothetical protein BJ986_002860 [Phycicoccus badiiscoriae]|uniref:Uncharacterized protein n=1 Tax=Pedococcus badiiscoriae TaxID=642776 RepID=A0A852WGI9_9MICO|nr:hypothetical protein [Pedococcus badiiscoriae]NYG08373.1 hypothetical protein [Pedococcus badiiscoriae]